MGKNKNKNKGKGAQASSKPATNGIRKQEPGRTEEEHGIFEIIDDDVEEDLDALNDTLPEEKGSKKAHKESKSKPETIPTNDITDDATEDDTGEDLWSEVLNEGSKKDDKEDITMSETKPTNGIEDNETLDDTGEDLWSEVLNEKSDEEKCRKNWSKGVQNTEDFFAGKGHPKRDAKVKNDIKKEDSPKPKIIEQPKPNASQADKSKEKSKEAPKTENIAAKEDKATPRVPIGDCIVCDRSAKAICSGCKHVFYCKRDCQKGHWGSHKEDCKSFAKLPYRIERDDEVGRHLVATRDIPAGQLIINELPIICGPRQLSKTVCLGCHKELTDPKQVKKCSRCSWPLCSRKCEDSPLHDPECRLLKYGGTKVQIEDRYIGSGQINMMYACITVLRALSLMDGPKKIWNDYTKFESHLEERLKTEVYTKVNKEKVVFVIQHYLKLINRYSDLEILEACGRLDTNCFEIKQNGVNLRAMYRIACIMSHDCKPNTRHTFGPDNSINIYATVNIPKGSKITATYTQPLWKTLNRREHLKMSKCFWCRCQRCRDPTEFGTGLSTLICNECGGKMLPIDPLDAETCWKCEKCGYQMTKSEVKENDDRLIADLKSSDPNDPAALDDFLRRHSAYLPDSNQLSREVQYRQVTLFKQVDQRLLDHAALLKKSYLCKQLLALADQVDPGMTKLRGELLFEMQAATVVLAQRALEEGKLTRFQAQEVFEEALEQLREAIGILQVEPDGKEELQEQMKNLSRILTDLDDEE